VKTTTQIGLAALFATAAMSGRVSAAPESPEHQVPMTHEQSADMETIHRLFAQSTSVRRTVRRLPNGVETMAESQDPKVAALLQEHVQAMRARLNNRQPIREWDPLFAELFKHAGKIRVQISTTPRGVRTLTTSTDPATIRLIHAHAEAVSGFIRDGTAGMAKRHENPLSKQAHPPSTAPFLGKGDGIKTCPVTGEPVQSDIKATMGGRTIHFCCESCIAVVKKNPQSYLKPPGR
jgi:YHS domain-containing protein